jgi:hypothetical protein
VSKCRAKRRSGGDAVDLDPKVGLVVVAVAADAGLGTPEMTVQRIAGQGLGSPFCGKVLT